MSSSSSFGSNKSTPTKEFDNIVLMAPTPKTLHQADSQTSRSLEKLLEEALSIEDASSIVQCRSFMETQLGENCDDTNSVLKWCHILAEIQNRWGVVFPQGGNYLDGFRDLEVGHQQGILVNLIPYLNFWITTNLEVPRQFPKFSKFLTALAFGIWLGRETTSSSSIQWCSAEEDRGVLLFQSLNSPVGSRLITKFFNWFTQHLHDQQSSFSEWYRGIIVSDSLFHCIFNDLAEESVLSQLGTTGYNDFASNEPLPLSRAEDYLGRLVGNFASDILKKPNGTSLLYAIILTQIPGGQGITCQISKELIDAMDAELMRKNLGDDPLERARIRNIWCVSILFVLVDCCKSGTTPPRPKCLQGDTAFYIYIAAKTASRVIGWYLNLAAGKNKNDAGSTSSGNNNGANDSKRQRLGDWPRQQQKTQ